MKKQPKLSPADAPRWRCVKCGVTLTWHPSKSEFTAGGCKGGCSRHPNPSCGSVFRHAPSIAVERAKKAVVRAAIVLAEDKDSFVRRVELFANVEELLDARTRASRARKAKP